MVTGGSSGLGKSTCELLLSEGARITIIDLIDPKNEIFDESRGLFIQGDVIIHVIQRNTPWNQLFL